MLALGSAIAITLGAVVGLHTWWHQDYQHLYPNSCYLLLDGLYLLLAGELLFSAFCLTRKQASWWRATLARGLLVVTSCVLLLAVADLYIIVFRFDTSGPGGVQCFTHRNWYRRFVTENQLSFWERDLTPYLEPRQSGDGIVIAALGDSFTWGQGVLGARHRFTNLLEPELQATVSTPVSVLNFAHGGKDTKEELLMLEDVAKVHPDIVLICYLSNDIGDYMKIIWPPAPPPSTIAQWLAPIEPKLCVFSPTYNFIYWTTRAPAQYRRNGNAYFEALFRAYRDPVLMNKHLADIDNIIARVRAMHAQPVLVILPFPSMWHDAPGPDDSAAGSKRTLRDQVYATLTQHAQAQNVPVIHANSVEDEMPPEQFAVNAMDGHPNAAAHQRICQIISAEFARQKLLTIAADH